VTTDRMIFLTTPMRSGSSLLSRILSANPAVAMSFDSVNFFRFCYQRYDPIAAPGNLEKLVSDMSHRLGNRFDIQLDVEHCLSLIPSGERSYGRAYWSILRTLFPEKESTWLGDKESMAWTRIPSFLDMFPDGRAVIIVRDPRDVVNSFKHTTIAPDNDYLIALFDVVDAINHATRLSLRDPSRVYMVRFERMKLDPENEIRKLCDFIGIDFIPQMLDFDQFVDHSGKKWDAKESLSFPEETNPLAPVGRWRKMITPDDLFLCEWIAGKQIQMIGQPLSGTPCSQWDFDSALQKINSSPLLRAAFKRWCESGEGSEQFPLDPTNPANWDPNWVKNPEAFATK
jgi:Sulfotransferase family